MSEDGLSPDVDHAPVPPEVQQAFQAWVTNMSLPGSPGHLGLRQAIVSVIYEAYIAAWIKSAERYQLEIEHARAALAHDNEGIRLFMLDVAEVSQRRSVRIEQLEVVMSEMFKCFVVANAGHVVAFAPIRRDFERWRDVYTG